MLTTKPYRVNVHDKLTILYNDPIRKELFKALTKLVAIAPVKYLLKNSRLTKITLEPYNTRISKLQSQIKEYDTHYLTKIGVTNEC